MAMRTNKSIFYHVPKTGGSWVERVISLLDVDTLAARHVWPERQMHPLGLVRKHTVPADVPRHETAGLLSYCFVRHPVAWYRSFWSSRLDRGGPNPHWSNQGFGLDEHWSDDFEIFMDRVLEAYPGGFVTRLYQSYVGVDGAGVDFVGRQEMLREDFETVRRLAGEIVDRGIIQGTRDKNVSSNTHGMVSPSPALVQRILATERWVLERFYA